MLDPAIQTKLVPQAPAAGVGASSRAMGGGALEGASELRGVRFQALLEGLDLRAKEMAKSAQEPLSPETLPAAVESARSSMEEALNLSRNLLEAWRQSTAQAPDSKPHQS